MKYTGATCSFLPSFQLFTTAISLKALSHSSASSSGFPEKKVGLISTACAIGGFGKGRLGLAEMGGGTATLRGIREGGCLGWNVLAIIRALARRSRCRRFRITRRGK